MDGRINIVTRCHKYSSWRSVLMSIDNLKKKGIDLYSYCTRKIGNGVDSKFWDDTCCDLAKDLWSLLAKWWEMDISVCNKIADWFDWLDSLRISSKVRLFLEGIASRVSLLDWSLVLRRPPRGGIKAVQFDALNVIIRNISLSDQSDSWNWMLGPSTGFSVASIRSLVDSYMLDTGNVATRWNKSIPIKVNVVDGHENGKPGAILMASGNNVDSAIHTVNALDNTNPKIQVVVDTKSPNPLKKQPNVKTEDTTDPKTPVLFAHEATILLNPCHLFLIRITSYEEIIAHGLELLTDRNMHQIQGHKIRGEVTEDRLNERKTPTNR
nr:RNA-directed DNA polymerase, eukaryota, reverse transcriptase zinc-binding domain protein [Tanacetum cinerariifolium]